MFNLLAENWRPLGLERFGPPARFSWLLITPVASYGSARHLVLILLDRASTRPVLVAKLPRLAGDHLYLEHEVVALRAAQAARPSGFDSIPRVVATGEVSGRRLLVETALDGRQMTPAFLRRRFEACTAAVTEWLIEFHQATADPRGVNVTALLDRPLEDFAPMLIRTNEDEWLVRRTRAILAPLCDARLPAVFEHGDLFYPNLLLHDGSIAVLDWETGEPRGFPAGDLFFFLGCAAFARASQADDDVDVGPFDEAFFPAASWTRPFIRRYVEALGLDCALLTPLFIAFWTRFVVTKAARMAGAAARDFDSLRRTGTLEHMARHLHALREYHLWRHAVLNIDRLHWDL